MKSTFITSINKLPCFKVVRFIKGNFCGKGICTVLVESDIDRLFCFVKVFTAYIEFPQPEAVFLFGTAILESFFLIAIETLQIFKGLEESLVKGKFQLIGR